MMATLMAQQLAPLSHLLRAGGPIGWLLLGLGAVLTLWGIVNLLQRPGCVVLTIQTLCSLIPALLGAGLAYVSYFEFAQIAAAAEAPKAVEFARLISRGLLGGMVGPVATVIPATLGIVGLARAAADRDSAAAEYQHV